ncbi:TPA: YHS domain-containing protein [archaeon]|nr:YHS domain-containing protein [Candidatus Naiadarchaeales archaeon SRR2090153.bin461]
MALDPICKMEVPEKEKDTIKLAYKGKTIFFCSDSCKAAFEKNPTEYVK